MIEGILCDFGNVVGESYAPKTCAAIKGARAEQGKLGAQGNLRHSGAARKGVSPHMGDITGQRKLR